MFVLQFVLATSDDEFNVLLQTSVAGLRTGVRFLFHKPPKVIPSSVLKTIGRLAFHIRDYFCEHFVSQESNVRNETC